MLSVRPIMPGEDALSVLPMPGGGRVMRIITDGGGGLVTCIMTAVVKRGRVRIPWEGFHCHAETTQQSASSVPTRWY